MSDPDHGVPDHGVPDRGVPDPEGPDPEGPVTRSTTGLADGEWHRLHPATPLLRGGIAFLAIIGIIVANLRERLVEIFFPAFSCEGPGCEDADPIGYLVDNGYLAMGLGALLLLGLILFAVFWVSWRMNTFRITDEVVEVRSGVLFRTHRQARLDRIQGVNVVRPFIARLFGAAKLEIAVAGQDANVSLQYLGGTQLEALRAEILRLASGTRQRDETGVRDASGSLIDRRIAELTAPELDPSLAAPESVVRMHPGRLIASTALGGTSVTLIVAVTVFVVLVSISAEFLYLLFGLIPMIIGLVSYLVNRVLKFLRYSIAATRDGVRIGHGLLSTRNDTLPPGRIHSISVSQSLLWRPADWWTVVVNRASRSSTQNQNQQQSSVVLPVGTRADAVRVLELLLPDLLIDSGDGSEIAGGLRALLEPGLTGRGDDAFTTSPRRAAVLRWFSWRRNGFALGPGAVLLRRGAIWRDLVIVPMPRMQSVSVAQGPLERSLDLAAVHVHTVAGPITARVGALDRGDAESFFRDLARAGVAAAAADRSHRWRSGEAPA